VRRRARGGSGTSAFSGWLRDTDPNTEIRGPDWYGAPHKTGIVQKMIRDPHVKRSVAFISDPLCAATWRFLPASKSAIDREVADFCTWAIVERLPWTRYLRRLVLGYAAAGFHFDEVTDDVCTVPQDRFPLHPGAGVGIAPTKLHDRPAHTITRWFQSKRDPEQLSAVEQTLLGSDTEEIGRIIIPANRLLRITHDQEGAYFPGMSVLRAAYQPWKLKIAFLAIDAIKHERTGVGVPMMELPEEPDPADVAAAEQILSAMRAQEKDYMILPNGYKFSWSGAGESNVSNIDLAIGRCNLDIAWNVAAGFQHLGLTNKGAGSYAVGGTQIGAYHLSISSHAALIAEAINLGMDGHSFVERYVRANYGETAGLPRLAAKNLPTHNWPEIAKTVNLCVAAGTITADGPLEEELRLGMSLGPHDPETAREKPASLGSQPSAEPEEPAGPEGPEEENAEDADAEPAAAAVERDHLC